MKRGRPEAMTLVTLEYPPDTGGVASYLEGLVEASEGRIHVFVSQNVQRTSMQIHPVRLFWHGPLCWFPMVWQMFHLSWQGYRILVSHVLPLGTSVWFVSWMCNTSYGVILHGLDIQHACSTPRKRWLLTHVLRRSRAVMVNSYATKHLLHEQGVYDGDIHVITPTIRCESIPDRRDARSTLSIDPNDVVILCVARLVARKGIDRLLLVTHTLPSFVRVVVIGEGPERDRLEKMVTPTDRVGFLGKVNHTLKQLWLAAADLFVLPGRDIPGDMEGFGLVFLEAAWAGLPCIGPRMGGVPEAIIDGETGLLVDPHDEQALSAAILGLVQDAPRRMYLGRQARVRMEQDGGWTERVQQLFDIFRL